MRIGKLSPLGIIIFLLLIILSGQVRASEEGTVTVGITPNPLMLSVLAREEVSINSHFVIMARIQNLGDERIRDVVATIYLDDNGLRLVGRKAEELINNIPPHGVRTAVWPVEAIKEGSYVVVVSVSGSGTPGNLATEESIIIEVTERHPRFIDRFWNWWRGFWGGRRK